MRVVQGELQLEPEDVLGIQRRFQRFAEAREHLMAANELLYWNSLYRANRNPWDELETCIDRCTRELFAMMGDAREALEGPY